MIRHRLMSLQLTGLHVRPPFTPLSLKPSVAVRPCHGPLSVHRRSRVVSAAEQQVSRSKSRSTSIRHLPTPGLILPSATRPHSHSAEIARHSRSTCVFASLAGVDAAGASVARVDTPDYLDPLFIPELEVVEVSVAGKTVRVVQPRCVDTVLDMYIAREAEKGEHKDPYWCQVWPCAQAIFREILEHPEAVKDRRVCDLGAGIGIAGLAALWAGAREVVFFDREPLALLSCLLTSLVNVNSFPHQHSSSRTHITQPPLASLQEWLTTAQLSGALKQILSHIALQSRQHDHQCQTNQLTSTNPSGEPHLDYTNVAGSPALASIHLPALQGSQVLWNGAIFKTEGAVASAEVLDWSHGDYQGEKFDTVLACDVLYDSSASSLLPRLLPNLLRKQDEPDVRFERVILVDPRNRFPANRAVFLKQMASDQSSSKRSSLHLKGITSTKIIADGCEMPVEIITFV